MKTQTFRKLLAAILLSSAALALTACNTTRGLGEDVEEAGEEIQDATNP